MTVPKVDMAFVRKTWEDPDHIGDYADAVHEVGLWDSERLLVSRYFAKDDPILDIGCGAGRTTIALYRLGYSKVQGLDLSYRMIEEASSTSEQAGYSIPFTVGNAIDIRYDDESFGGALFTAQGFMCIPGSANRLRALKEVRRVLRPGGHFFFTTHDRFANQEFASFWDEEESRWSNGTQDERLLELGDRIVLDSGTLTYIHIPTREQVAEAVRQAGMVVVEDPMRSELTFDTEAARRFSSDCRMWVVQRPEREDQQ